MQRVSRFSICGSILSFSCLVILQSQPMLAQGGGQGGGGPKQSVTSISAGAGIELTPNPITTTGSVAVADSGVTNSMLAGGIAPSKITGTAAVLGANTFTATQALSNGNLALPATAGAASGVLTLGGARFLHGFGSTTPQFENTFVGINAGNFTMTGISNTSVGAGTLPSNTIGTFNTAMGERALRDNTVGSNNTALGVRALLMNAGGDSNTAVGMLTLASNTSGTANIAVGYVALQTANGHRNIAIGAGAGFNLMGGEDDNIYIGHAGVATEDGTIRIGTGSAHTRAFITGISNSTVTGSAVYVDTNGQLGVMPSAHRFKYDIQPMNQATRNLLRLRPVTFRYRQAQNDGSHPLQFGLIAEEVAEVYPDMVQTTAGGEPNAVFYQFLPAMLLNEFQKQHQQIEAQQAQIEALQIQLEQLVADTRRVQNELAAFRSSQERGANLMAVTSRP